MYTRFSISRASELDEKGMVVVREGVVLLCLLVTGRTLQVATVNAVGKVDFIELQRRRVRDVISTAATVTSERHGLTDDSDSTIVRAGRFSR